MTRVSVIIPAYNRAKSIGKALESVLQQRFAEWEAIVYDDGSKDETRSLVAEIAKKDSRIRLISGETNHGAAYGRNRAVEAARGAYLAFLDSDDRWYPDKLSVQVQKMDALDSRWAASYTGARVLFINRGRWVSYRPTLEGNLLPKMLLHRTQMWTPTVMVRTSVYRELGGMDETLIRHQDIDLYRRIAQRYLIAAIPEELAEIFLFTNKAFDERAIAAKEIMHDRYYNMTREICGRWSASRVWAREWLAAAGLACRSRRYGVSWQYFMRAMRTNPMFSPRDVARLVLNLIRSLQVLPAANDTGETFHSPNRGLRSRPRQEHVKSAGAPVIEE